MDTIHFPGYFINGKEENNFPLKQAIFNEKSARLRNQMKSASGRVRGFPVQVLLNLGQKWKAHLRNTAYRAGRRLPRPVKDVLRKHVAPHFFNSTSPAGSQRQQDKSRTSEFWDREAGTWELGRGIHWTEHLAVQERFNLKTGGHIHRDLFIFLSELLEKEGCQLPLERALTLGCGAGEFQRRLAGYNICLKHDGYDISGESIRIARKKAEGEGLTGLSYEVRDIDKISLPPDCYDLVFGIHSVHHFRELEYVFSEVRKTLKPGGFFILHEFIGPTRFQWSDRQLEIVNGLLNLLPERYLRNRKERGTFIQTVGRPSIQDMISMDPSEAVRSADIVKVLPEFFEIVEFKNLGGALLQLLLEGITGNFDYDNPEDMKYLKLFFEIEDLMMDLGEIPSDFAIIFARKNRE